MELLHGESTEILFNQEIEAEINSYPFLISSSLPMTKIVLNVDIPHGPFQISDAAIAAYKEYHGYEEDDEIDVEKLDRDDPGLVYAVETLRRDANVFSQGTAMTHLVVLEIPDGVNWVVQDDEDGVEYIQEVARSWHFPRKREIGSYGY